MKTTSKSGSKKRVITVSYLASPRGGHNYSNVPFIRLSGKWVEKMGFTIGQRLQVTIAENRLTISKAEEPEK